MTKHYKYEYRGNLAKLEGQKIEFEGLVSGVVLHKGSNYQNLIENITVNGEHISEHMWTVLKFSTETKKKRLIQALKQNKNKRLKFIGKVSKYTYSYDKNKVNYFIDIRDIIEG